MSTVSTVRWRGLSLSLNTRICAVATALVVASLAVTATVIGIKSGAAAEKAAMAQARSSVHEAAYALRSRLGANLAVVRNLAGGMAASRGADLTLSRPQIGVLVKSALLDSEDFVGAAVVWEPNALDGKDAEYAGKRPEYDDTGRYMPYFSRSADGTINVEPIVLSNAIEVYNTPRDTGHAYFSEPYFYSVNGQNLAMTTMSVPILIEARFQGVAIADFVLSRLGKILADIKVIEGGRLTLVSNGGVYASHPDAARNGGKADDIPPAGIESIRVGRPFEYQDNAGVVHLLEPLSLGQGAAPWAVRLSFPRSVALAPAKDLMRYTMLVAILCAIVAAVMLIGVLNLMMRPLGRLSVAMTELAGGEANLTRRLEVRGSDELADISDGFNRFVAKIQDVLAKVRDCSSDVACASSEIR